MSITSYSELQTAVGNWLNRPDLSSYIPDLVMMGQLRIYRDMRIRAMESALNVTIDGSGNAALPTDYTDLKYAYIDGTPTQPLQRRNVQYIFDTFPTRSSDAKPKFISRDAGNFIFGPFPDSTYTVKGTYYARLPLLSNSNTTNWFIVNAPDLLLFAALTEAEKFIKNDDRVALWSASYESIKTQIVNEERRESHSGSAPTSAVSAR